MSRSMLVSGKRLQACMRATSGQKTVGTVMSATIYEKLTSIAHLTPLVMKVEQVSGRPDILMKSERTTDAMALS